jgi:hypothetical protein
MKEIKILQKQEEPKEVEKPIIKEYELVQVPTGNTIAIQTPEGEIMNTEFALVEILNKLIKMEKAILG